MLREFKFIDWSGDESGYKWNKNTSSCVIEKDNIASITPCYDIGKRYKGDISYVILKKGNRLAVLGNPRDILAAFDIEKVG